MYICRHVVHKVSGSGGLAIFTKQSSYHTRGRVICPEQ